MKNPKGYDRQPIMVDAGNVAASLAVKPQVFGGRGLTRLMGLTMPTGVAFLQVLLASRSDPFAGSAPGRNDGQFVAWLDLEVNPVPTAASALRLSASRWSQGSANLLNASSGFCQRPFVRQVSRH